MTVRIAGSLILSILWALLARGVSAATIDLPVFEGTVGGEYRGLDRSADGGVIFEAIGTQLLISGVEYTAEGPRPNRLSRLVLNRHIRDGSLRGNLLRVITAGRLFVIDVSDPTSPQILVEEPLPGSPQVIAPLPANDPETDVFALALGNAGWRIVRATGAGVETLFVSAPGVTANILFTSMSHVIGPKVEGSSNLGAFDAGDPSAPELEFSFSFDTLPMATAPDQPLFFAKVVSVLFSQIDFTDPMNRQSEILTSGQGFYDASFQSIPGLGDHIHILRTLGQGTLFHRLGDTVPNGAPGYAQPIWADGIDVFGDLAAFRGVYLDGAVMHVPEPGEESVAWMPDAHQAGAAAIADGRLFVGRLYSPSRHSADGETRGYDISNGLDAIPPLGVWEPTSQYAGRMSVQVRGDHLFVGSASGFDVLPSDAPGEPIARLDEGIGHFVLFDYDQLPGSAVSGLHAFGSGVGDTALPILDLSDPAAPTEISSMTLDGIRNIAVHASVAEPARLTAYLAQGTPGALCAVDVTNPLATAVIGSTELSGQLYANTPNPMSVGGDLLAVGLAGQGVNPPGGVDIFRLHPGAIPEHLATIATSTNPAGLSISGTTLAAAVGSRLLTWDITDPTAPRETGRLPLPGTATHLTREGDLAVVSETLAGLELYRMESFDLVELLLDHLLGKPLPDGLSLSALDVNGDGLVDSADLTALLAPAS